MNERRLVGYSMNMKTLRFSGSHCNVTEVFILILLQSSCFEMPCGKIIKTL